MSLNTMTKRTLQTTFLAGALLALAGCSDSDSPVSETEVAFPVSANAAQVLVSNPSTATATGAFTLDTNTMALSGSVAVSGMEVTAAHIHEGIAGTSGGVVVGLEVDGTTLSVAENTTIAADQVQSMLDGDYYLNVHSTAYPAGEIRGQLTGPDVSVAQVTLSGDNEVPAVTTAATGTGYVTLNTASGLMRVQVISTGITTPTAAHVHVGTAEANGDVLFALTQDSAEVGNFSGSDTLDAAELATVTQGGTYLNVHSDENPSGELRGQIELP